MNPILFHTKNSNTEIPTLTRHRTPSCSSKLGKDKTKLGQIKRRITVYSIAQSIKGKRPLREIYSTAFQQTCPFRPRLFPKIVTKLAAASRFTTIFCPPNAPKASLHYNSEPQHKIASNLSYWSEGLTSR